jgi:hypothetical protein
VLTTVYLQLPRTKELHVPYCHICRSIRIRDVRSIIQNQEDMALETDEGNRAFDSASDKIWDSWNKGVC